MSCSEKIQYLHMKMNKLRNTRTNKLFEHGYRACLGQFTDFQTLSVARYLGNGSALMQFYPNGEN